MRTLEAVIFDMDGVLTETSHQHFLAWKMLAQKLGYDLPNAVNDQVKGISRLESLEIVLKAGNMSDKFSDSEKVQMADDKNAIYQSLIKEFTKENVSEGALELLKSLKENNIKIGLASVSKNAPFLLEAMEISEYFDVVVDPREIKHGKPAPDIFLMAAKKLGAAPENCIGVEDAYAGVESIKSAKMTPVGIGTKEVLSNCETVLSNLNEVNIEFLRRLL